MFRGQRDEPRWFDNVHSSFAMVRNVLVVMSTNTHKQTYTHISHFCRCIVTSVYRTRESNTSIAAEAASVSYRRSKPPHTMVTTMFCHETDDRPCATAALMRYLHSFPCCVLRFPLQNSFRSVTRWYQYPVCELDWCLLPAFVS